MDAIDAGPRAIVVGVGPIRPATQQGGGYPDDPLRAVQERVHRQGTPRDERWQRPAHIELERTSEGLEIRGGRGERLVIK